MGRHGPALQALERNWHVHPGRRVRRRGPSRARRPDRQGDGDGRVAVRQAVRGQGGTVGRSVGPAATDRGPVAQVPGQVAVPRAHLQQRRDREADPNRGGGVRHDGHDVAEDHGCGPGGAQGCGRAERGKLAGRSGRVQQATGHRREGTERLFGHQEDGVPPLFLPVQRRAPGDFIRGQGSAPSAAVHEEVLRGCAKSGIHRARHDEDHRVRGGRVRSAVQRNRPGGDGRGGEVDARVRGRHEGFVAQGDARIRGVLHHETERGVDFGLARAGGHRRVAGALDQRSHRRHRRRFFKGVRREVQRATDQHRQHGAGRVDQTGAGDDVGAGHHRRARPRRRRPDVSRRRARSQGLQVARAAALLLGGRHPQVPHDQRAGAVRL